MAAYYADAARAVSKAIRAKTPKPMRVDYFAADSDGLDRGREFNDKGEQVSIPQGVQLSRPTETRVAYGGRRRPSCPRSVGR